MTQLTSIRQFERDPEPFAAIIATAEGLAVFRSSTNVLGTRKYSPRVRCERPQVNPTYVVLADLRSRFPEERRLTARHAVEYLAMVDVEHMDAPREHVDHALAVLVRAVVHADVAP